jgi:flagellar biogenesis protein FliO
MLVYAAVASTIVGDILINLRSINTQDKALSIGYIMSLIGFFAYIVGKLSYDEFAKSTCSHWGFTDRRCHLHHPTKLGNYLCFVTSGLIVVGAFFKLGVWFFSKDLEIYDSVAPESQQLTEMKDMSKTQAEPLLQSQSNDAPDNTENNQKKGNFNY